jgi:hypothetical protein
MTYKENNYNIELKTNDDFRTSVTIDYDISTSTPLFKIKKNNTDVIDFSEYITIEDDNTFVINVPASVLEDIGEIKNGKQYDCTLDLGNGSKEFLFGGLLTIVNGIS